MAIPLSFLRVMSEESRTLFMNKKKFRNPFYAPFIYRGNAPYTNGEVLKCLPSSKIQQ